MRIVTLRCINGNHSMCDDVACECGCHEPNVPTGHTGAAKWFWWGTLITSSAYVIAFVIYSIVVKP